MKINTIISSSYPKYQSFNGHWEDKIVFSTKKKPLYQKREYLPDGNESAKEIALAWEKETNDLPIDWVKKNNMYSQTGFVRYQLKDQKYLPLDVLKESVKIKADRKKEKFLVPEEEILYCAEIANLAKQENDMTTVKEMEANMQKAYDKINNENLQERARNRLNEYKGGFGDMIFFSQYK